MKKQKVKIYMNGKYLETCRNRESAELRIRSYEKQDRYDVATKMCAMPSKGYPVYMIVD